MNTDELIKVFLTIHEKEFTCMEYATCNNTCLHYTECEEGHDVSCRLTNHQVIKNWLESACNNIEDVLIKIES